MHSGGVGRWKIECDALTDEDWKCLAFMLHEVVPPFGLVYGIPKGGQRLAQCLSEYADRSRRLLLVDDVLTTGASMEEERKKRRRDDTLGAVVFARGECPNWITPLFQMAFGGDHG